ncbi:MAG: hypothetical protein BMS9Abin10_0237 [Gammaproteobacteria bacterium]|nr:MAG: hypothetical protein BMS9Abin10_0237 [Gammaproteobacteria bacterium]
MGRMHERLYEIGLLMECLRKEYPSQTEAFLNFLEEGEGGAALSLKEKELIKPALAHDVRSAGGAQPPPPPHITAARAIWEPLVSQFEPLVDIAGRTCEDRSGVGLSRCTGEDSQAGVQSLNTQNQ